MKIEDGMNSNSQERWRDSQASSCRKTNPTGIFPNRLTAEFNYDADRRKKLEGKIERSDADKDVQSSAPTIQVKGNLQKLGMNLAETDREKINHASGREESILGTHSD